MSQCLPSLQVRGSGTVAQTTVSYCSFYSRRRARVSTPQSAGWPPTTPRCPTCLCPPGALKSELERKSQESVPRRTYNPSFTEYGLPFRSACSHFRWKIRVKACLWSHHRSGRSQCWVLRLASHLSCQFSSVLPPALEIPPNHDSSTTFQNYKRRTCSCIAR